MLKPTLRSILGGFFMGTADLVPGVSGGTIALVLGIYERLVSSIREGSSALGSIVTGDPKSAKKHLGRVEWSFLVPLVGGIGLAIVLLASFLERQLEERPTVIAAAFLGLVLMSIVIAWRQLKRPDQAHVVIAAAVALGLFAVLGLGEGEVSGDPGLLVFFGAGALAICAMILPGISGSLILLLIGMYAPVLGAVTTRDFVTIGVFALGAVMGLALFSQALHWALGRYHDVVLAALVGLMAGSTRVLWPWPDGVASSQLAAPSEDWPIALAAGLVGAGAVYLIARLGAARGALVSESPAS